MRNPQNEIFDLRFGIVIRISQSMRCNLCAFLSAEVVNLSRFIEFSALPSFHLILSAYSGTDGACLLPKVRMRAACCAHARGVSLVGSSHEHTVFTKRSRGYEKMIEEFATINELEEQAGPSDHTDARLKLLAQKFRNLRASMTSTGSSMAAIRQFGTARLTPGRTPGRQLDQPEPMIAIALSDMEYLMRTARSGRGSGRTERQAGCTCCCHIVSGVNVIPRSARFTTLGGLSTHTLMNTRIAVKITCSDNNMYRVTPVYATVEPGQSLPLHIARVKSELIKRDRLCVNVIEAEGSKDARESFKKCSARPAVINLALDVRESDEPQL
ncbi:unnamed protein product [Caenorhabditis auriculariae]|uniref:Major sperm protein n=1 Tax=Caenorhabditis auriculariae TaxID=2777116 RepID=A0A8S1GXY4_9PELO|nr:unnamed protein product [Caenorhabditis auriculariae]